MIWKKYKNKEHYGFKLYDENDSVILKMELGAKKAPTKASLEIGKEQFCIKRKGFWKTGIAVTDEDDKIIAEVKSEKQHYGLGSISIDKNKFYYNYRNNPLVELQMYSNPYAPLITYNLITKSKTPAVALTISEQLKKMPQHKILIALTWYMFQPIARENSIICSE